MIRPIVPILICLLLMAGCSDQIPFSGKVAFEDGSPVTSGTVVFSDGERQFDGDIKPDGTYALGGNKKNDGILPGQYRISVNVAPGDDGKPLIAEKYTSVETSELTFEVKVGGPKTFDIKVEKP